MMNKRLGDGLMFTKGNQIFHAEIEEGGRSRRFALPLLDNVAQRLVNFLSDKPGMILKAHGFGTVLDELDASNMDSITGYPTTHAFNLEMPDHPVIQQGQGRYSPTLVAALEEQPSQPQLQAPEAPAAPTTNLTDQLRAQITQQKKPLTGLNQTEPLKKEDVVTPEVIAKPKQTLSDFLAQNKKSTEQVKEQARSFSNGSQPVSKIDRILEEVTGMRDKLEAIQEGLGIGSEAPSQTEPVSGAELQEWFQQHAESVGIERAFEILAEKVKF